MCSSDLRHLATQFAEPVRTEVEGAVDAAGWTTAAAASLASTAIMAVTGYPALALCACALAGLIAVGGASTSRAPAPGRAPACAPDCGGGGEESGKHVTAGGGAGARGSRRRAGRRWECSP